MDQIQTSSISTPPVAPIPEPKVKIWVWIVGGVLLLGIGIVSGVFLGKQLYSIPQPVPTPLPSEASAKEGDPTANWKTYTNTKHNFKIKYPAGWVPELINETLVNNFNLKKNSYILTISYPVDIEPDICIFSDNPNFTKDLDITHSQKCSGEYVEIDSSNHLSRRTVMPNITQKQATTWVIYTKNDEGVYVTVPPIYYEAPNNYDSNIIKEMDQILSTFKFLE